MEKTTHIIIDSFPFQANSIFEIFNSFLTPLIAILAIVITYRQYKTDSIRLKHELYEKRFNVFKDLHSFLANFLREGSQININIIHEYRSNTFISCYLFKKDIQEYLEEIYNKAIQVWTIGQKLSPSNGGMGLPVGDERSKLCEEERLITLWLCNQIKNSNDLFKKYFQIR